MMQISPLSSQLSTVIDPARQQLQNQADFSKVLEQKLQNKNQNTPQDQAKLRKTCQEMEAIFLNMMLTTMRSTVPKNNLLGDNSKTDIMKSMLDTEMTKQMAYSGGIGLADLLYKQLNQTQK